MEVVFYLLETLALVRQRLFVICFVPEHQAHLYMNEFLGIISACIRIKGRKMQQSLCEILQI